RLPAVTGDTLPLPLTPAAIRGLLRRDVGYGGVVMVDLSASSPLLRGREAPAAAVAALEAGADLLLGVEEPAAVVDAVVAAVATGRLSEERLASAVRRVLRLRLAVAPGDSAQATRRAAAAAVRAAGTGELASHPAVRTAR